MWLFLVITLYRTTRKYLRGWKGIRMSAETGGDKTVNPRADRYRRRLLSRTFYQMSNASFWETSLRPVQTTRETVRYSAYADYSNTCKMLCRVHITRSTAPFRKSQSAEIEHVLNSADSCVLFAGSSRFRAVSVCFTGIRHLRTLAGALRILLCPHVTA